MGRQEPEACPRCGARLVRFQEDDGRARAVCPRCEADALAAIFEREPKPGERGPGRPRRRGNS